MTTTPQPRNDRIDRIEATLERLAELTFQNVVRYDCHNCFVAVTV